MSPDLCFIVFSTRALFERNAYVRHYMITCNDNNIERILVALSFTVNRIIY